MGNSVQTRKKVHTERSFSALSSPSSNREKPKGFWPFGRQEKFQTGGLKGTEDQKRLAVHYTTSEHYQENVFIEGSRPQYLEDLHTEAQEGLKILQQEEHKNGVNFPEDESVASTGTLRPEQDSISKDRGGSLESRSTTGSSDTLISPVSTRPVLTRQGSTFKPLNPVKRLDKSRRRNRRTTIMGIPNQVQKELALHRNSTFQQLVPAQHSNGDEKLKNLQAGVVIIPTVDGGFPVENQEGARIHLSELEHTSRDEQLLRKHLRAMYQDEHILHQHNFGSDLCSSSLRPKSLAVPGMTSSSSSPSTLLGFLQELQGPVMSMSPQATYLSTIIPNAILPASVEVIEIDRSSSRTRGSSISYGESVRAISKSSLESGDSSISPLLSRRSDGDGSQTDNSHDSTLMPTSIPTSKRSKSQSSKSAILNPSPVSSKHSICSGNSQRECLNGKENQSVQPSEDNYLPNRNTSLSMIGSTNSTSDIFVTGQRTETTLSEAVDAGEETKSTKQNCPRSLSVMKTKQPPAPPRRTNSLHSHRIKTNTLGLVESKDLNNSASGGASNTTDNNVGKDETKSFTTYTNKVTVLNSTGSSSVDASSNSASSMQTSFSEAQRTTESSTSSPQKTPSEGCKFERTMSPSSGYSSQSGTPTFSPKGISPTSPDKQKKKPVKPERSVSRTSSSAASPSSSLTSLSSGTSESVNPDMSTCSPSLPSQELPSTAAIVLTPNNNSSTLSAEIIELLKIPPPPKVRAPCPPPPETWAYNRQSLELLCRPCPTVSKVTLKPVQTGNSTVKQAVKVENEASKTIQVLVENQPDTDKSISDLPENKADCEILLAAAPEDLKSKGHPFTEQVKMEENRDIQTPEQNSIPVVKYSENQDRAPKKDPPPVMKKIMTILNREELMSRDNLPSADKKISSQNRIIVVGYKNDNDIKSEGSSMPEVPKISKSSPPPTPPPAYHPTPPLSRKTPFPSVLMPPDELEKVQEESHVLDSCWPPPPPPMEGDSVFEGDEIDFPPPPPLLETESVSNAMDSPVIPDLDVSKRTTEVDSIDENSSDAGIFEPEQMLDLTPVIPQTITDNKLEDILQDSKAEISKEISCTTKQNTSVSDSVLTPPVKRSPLPPMTTECPLSASALPSPSNFLLQDSVMTEEQSPSESLVSTQPPINVPVSPPLPGENSTHGVYFRRQPSVANRDNGSKELVSRNKIALSPKEDANIPLVTPSLLQMVRLRSVNMSEDQIKDPAEDTSTDQGTSNLENCPVLIQGPQNIPQKPIRKSLSLKSSPQTGKVSSVTLNTPSMRLQEAIRMKTAAMSSRDGLPSRLGVRSSTYSSNSEHGSLFLKSPDRCDMYKSPASTASFIFSRSTKKIVIETSAASSPEAQASLKQSLAAELMQVSDQSKATSYSSGGMKSDKVPPPVAKKPAHCSLSLSQNQPAYSEKKDLSVEGNREIGVQEMGGTTLHETRATRVTADTIETLF
ncbi:NHS-like protein 3 isoform X2 [Antennarius striatus]|uniref:NHS-like protein 3 isoform X2 n=1 Tax=Antennarius striatus TaxID=241820 RepID=UPI0035B288D5